MKRWCLLSLGLASSCAAPLVQVSAAKPKGRCGERVIVIGAVGKPGRFEVSETPTLLSAISRAGGFTAEAHKGAVVVERCANERWEEFHVACDRVARGGEGDLFLVDGDIVHVPTFD
jgi:protein involved in polysaccharide export with SLBB domain